MISLIINIICFFIGFHIIGNMLYDKYLERKQKKEIIAQFNKWEPGKILLCAEIDECGCLGEKFTILIHDKLITELEETPGIVNFECIVLCYNLTTNISYGVFCSRGFYGDYHSMLEGKSIEDLPNDFIGLIEKDLFVLDFKKFKVLEVVA